MHEILEIYMNMMLLGSIYPTYYLLSIIITNGKIIVIILLPFLFILGICGLFVGFIFATCFVLFFSIMEFFLPHPNKPIDETITIT